MILAREEENGNKNFDSFDGRLKKNSSERRHAVVVFMYVGGYESNPGIAVEVEAGPEI